ncbi:MAG TPA: NAD(P)-dependent oxidoreductase [Candidatus Limnocylindrales bacterium]|nr:NAD(P)-dependent oxidoreductase [Candidatus Limnocylindrales bacterium]
MKNSNDSASAPERLGFIGLGNMGGAIALRLLRAGYPLTVLDLDKNKMNPLIKAGAGIAATPKQVAERSTIVLVSLQPKDVEEVACGENGIAEANKAGLVFIDLSSTAPELAIKVSNDLRAQGVEMLDAPLSGADIGATNGELTIFVGGSYAAYQRALPVLQHVGWMVTYLGKNGNGQIGKRTNQMMQALSELAIYEGLLLAKKSGLDMKTFARAASAGCAQSWRLDELVDNVFNKGDTAYKLGMRPGRTGDALMMAEELGLNLAGAKAADQTFSRHGWQVEIDFASDEIPDS